MTGATKPSWNWLGLVAPVTPFPEPQGPAVSASVAKVAPEFFGRESVDIPNMSRDVIVAPAPLWSRKSRRIIMIAKVWTCLFSVRKVWTCQNLSRKSGHESGTPRPGHLHSVCRNFLIIRSTVRPCEMKTRYNHKMR